jgi:hypothetical protein
LTSFIPTLSDFGILKGTLILLLAFGMVVGFILILLIIEMGLISIDSIGGLLVAWIGEGTELETFDVGCESGDDSWVDVVFEAEALGEDDRVVVAADHERGVAVASELDHHFDLVWLGFDRVFRVGW